MDELTVFIRVKIDNLNELSLSTPLMVKISERNSSDKIKTTLGFQFSKTLEEGFVLFAKKR